MMDAPENTNASRFEKVAQRQAGTHPFPQMTDRTARNASLLMAAAFVLPILGLIIYGFRTERWTLASGTSALLIGIWLAYFLILHGIMKRRRQM